MIRQIKRLLIWFLVAFLLCMPTSLSLSSKLLGDPQIDVWNHAWGYWFVFQSLMEGVLPFETELIGAPGGGALYYIDTPGAIAGLPFTALFGAAFSYNVILLFRFALSALATQLLTEELSEKGWHSWVAGLGTLSLPFLLCEVTNGISEVCDIEWGIFALWATARYLKTGTRKHALWIGFFQGMTIMATFYYGMAIGILLIFLLGQKIILGSIEEKKLHKSLLDSVLAAGLAILVAFPSAFAFWSSLQSETRLVLRDSSLNIQLLQHNAVDPRIYFHPGAFQSVNLKEDYGEAFVHTAYLRWSLFPLAFWIGWIRKELRIWLYALFLSLFLGLGSFLWWNGSWVNLGGLMLPLPFEGLRTILPQIAITHPLRLSIGGQIICVALGLAGWNQLSKRCPLSPKIFFPLLAILISGEGLFGSSASFPIRSSDASIPAFYELQDDRGVLDLPAEAGTSMRTSQYFWYQTKHKKPIPYTPDARIGSTRDFETFKNFLDEGNIENPRELIYPSDFHIRNTYQLIVVHSDIDAVKSKQYIEIFRKAFGEPTQYGDDSVWHLEPLEEDEVLPEYIGKTKISPYSDDGEEVKSFISCKTPQATIALLLKDKLSEEGLSLLNSCGAELAKYCMQRSKSRSITPPEANYCLDILEQHHDSDNQYAFLHLLRHEDSKLKILVAKKLLNLPKSRSVLPKERIQQLAETESQEVQSLYMQLISGN